MWSSPDEAEDRTRRGPEEKIAPLLPGVVDAFYRIALAGAVEDEDHDNSEIGLFCRFLEPLLGQAVSLGVEGDVLPSNHHPVAAFPTAERTTLSMGRKVGCRFLVERSALLIDEGPFDAPFLVTRRGGA